MHRLATVHARDNQPTNQPTNNNNDNNKVLHHSNISNPPAVSSWQYCATDSAFMADGLSEWLVRRSGIPCQRACAIQLFAESVSDNLWRRFCSQRTDAFSALQVSRWCTLTLHKSTFYLLLYLHNTLGLTAVKPGKYIQVVEWGSNNIIWPLLFVYKSSSTLC